MATDFSGEPEVDLGFRNPATANLVPSTDKQLQLPLFWREISRDYPHRRLWSLPIALVIGLFAAGALTSSVLLFNNLERPTTVKRWKRDAYIPPRPEELRSPPMCLELRLAQSPSVEIGAELSCLNSQAGGFSGLLGDVAGLLQQPSLLLSFAVSPLPNGFNFDASAAPELGSSIGAEKSTRVNASQKRNIRIAAEKMRKREIARRLRRRIANRVTETAKSFASFWALWSQHLLGSGLAIPGNTRRLASQRSRAKRLKASPGFPLSWNAVASPSAKRTAFRRVPNRFSVNRNRGHCSPTRYPCVDPAVR